MDYIKLIIFIIVILSFISIIYKICRYKKSSCLENEEEFFSPESSVYLDFQKDE